MSLTRRDAPGTSSTRLESRPQASAPSFEEQVRESAYKIYLSRIREGVPGDAATDWLRAEQELRRRR